ncbi:MAG: hypothetical protein Fur007_15860 [Rhodoferax sp.]
MTANEILVMMRKGMGQVPAAIEKSVAVDPALIQEHVRAKGFAMPPENGAMDEETRTMIYLAAALASGSATCIQAMANKIAQQGMSAAKALETVRIVRFALSSKVIGDAEAVFDAAAKTTNR